MGGGGRKDVENWQKLEHNKGEGLLDPTLKAWNTLIPFSDYKMQTEKTGKLSVSMAWHSKTRANKVSDMRIGISYEASAQAMFLTKLSKRPADGLEQSTTEDQKWSDLGNLIFLNQQTNLRNEHPQQLSIKAVQNALKSISLRT